MKKILMTLGVLGFVYVASAQTATETTKTEVKRVEKVETAKTPTLQASPNKAVQLRATKVQRANLSTTKKAVIISDENKLNKEALQRKDNAIELKKIEGTTK